MTYRSGDVARAMADELRAKLEAETKRADAFERAHARAQADYAKLLAQKTSGARSFLLALDAIALTSAWLVTACVAVAMFCRDALPRAGAYAAAALACYALLRRRLTGRWL